MEGWKRGVCVWNQVAGSCILSGVAGHTLPHCHFTAMQCIGIIRLELQAIKYPSTALWARVYNFSKSFSYAGAQRFSTSCNARLACTRVQICAACTAMCRKSVTQMSVKCAVCCSVLQCVVCSVGASSVTRCRWSGDTVGVMGHSLATSLNPLIIYSLIITNLMSLEPSLHLCSI